MPNRFNPQMLSDTDPFLEYLVKIVNDSSMEMSITLNVKGAIVSGQLISGKTYFLGLAADMKKANADEIVRDGFQMIFKHRSTSYMNLDDDEEETILTEFIHLKDVNMYLSNLSSFNATQISYWRGRLSEIDGFSLASFTT